MNSDRWQVFDNAIKKHLRQSRQPWQVVERDDRALEAILHVRTERKPGIGPGATFRRKQDIHHHWVRITVGDDGSPQIERSTNERPKLRSDDKP